MAATTTADDDVDGIITQLNNLHFVDDKIVAHYLSVAVNIDPVKLPNLLTASEDETYAPLILDGASGVGKTQQFFALVRKDQYSGIYVIPTAESFIDNRHNAQEIYLGMIQKTPMILLLATLKKAKDFLERAAIHTTADEKSSYPPRAITDPFSVRNIKFTLNSGSQELLEAVKYLFLGIVSFNIKENKLVLDSNKNAADIDPREAEEELKGKILFIDEALNNTNDLPFLRFLRNFGRVLGMRCVLAGTAATAANMLCENWNKEQPELTPGSRGSDDGERLWCVVCFLWREKKPFLVDILG